MYIEGGYFDPEPYNYIFNKNTPYTEGEFVLKDPKQLRDILKEFKKLDIDYLDILNYTQDVHLKGSSEPQFNSALHRVVQEENKLSIDIILKSISLIDFDCTRNYHSIFDQLIESKSFSLYMEAVPI